MMLAGQEHRSVDRRTRLKTYSMALAQRHDIQESVTMKPSNTLSKEVWLWVRTEVQ